MRPSAGCVLQLLCVLLLVRVACKGMISHEAFGRVRLVAAALQRFPVCSGCRLSCCLGVCYCLWFGSQLAGASRMSSGACACNVTPRAVLASVPRASACIPAQPTPLRNDEHPQTSIAVQSDPTVAETL